MQIEKEGIKMDQCFGEYFVLSRCNNNNEDGSIFAPVSLREGERLAYESPKYDDLRIWPPASVSHVHIEGADATIIVTENYHDDRFCSFIATGDSVEAVKNIIDFVEHVFIGAVDYLEPQESFLKYEEALRKKSAEKLREIEKMKGFFGPFGAMLAGLDSFRDDMMDDGTDSFSAFMNMARGKPSDFGLPNFMFRRREEPREDDEQQPDEDFSEEQMSEEEDTQPADDEISSEPEDTQPVGDENPPTGEESSEKEDDPNTDN